MISFPIKFGINFVVDIVFVTLIYYAITLIFGPFDLHALVLGCVMCVGMYAMKWITAKKCKNEDVAHDATAQMASMAVISAIISILV